MHSKNVRDDGDQADRRQIFEWIVGKLLIEVRRNGQRGGRTEQDGITIGGSLGRDFRADDTTRSRPVIDDHRLAQRFGELLAYRARNDIRSSAWRVRRDEADHPAWIAWRRGAERRSRDYRSGDQARCERSCLHNVSPDDEWSCLDCRVQSRKTSV